MACAVNEAMAIGKQLVALCREGKNLEALDTLYSEGITSIEAGSGDCTGEAAGFSKVMTGIEQIRAKNVWWSENHEVHGAELDGPYPNGDQFIVCMAYDITSKTGPMEGTRMQMKEMGLYTVEGGKIVKEEFFYDMSGGDS